MGDLRYQACSTWFGRSVWTEREGRLEAGRKRETDRQDRLTSVCTVIPSILASISRNTVILNNFEKTKIVLSLVADLTLQEEINERKCYLLRIVLCPPQIHMWECVLPPSPHCPFPPSLPCSVGCMNGWVDGFFYKCKSDILSAHNPLVAFSFIRGKPKVLESSSLTALV